MTSLKPDHDSFLAILQVRVERAAVPQEQREGLHLEHTTFILSPDAAMADAVNSVKGDGKTAGHAVRGALTLMRDQDAPALREALPQSVRSLVNCEHIGDVCAAAYVIDTADAMLGDAADSAAAPEWHRAVTASALAWLQAQTRGAPEDTLQDVAQVRHA